MTDKRRKGRRKNFREERDLIITAQRKSLTDRQTENNMHAFFSAKKKKNREKRDKQ